MLFPKETIYIEKDALGEEKKTLEESSSRLRGIIARKKIYAPLDGVILKLELQQGSVLAPGSKILSIVPDGVKLIAEIKTRIENAYEWDSIFRPIPWF